MLLVGRDRELTELCGLLDSATRGRGSLALLVGEPGIGKTRLADAVAQCASERAFRVAWGRAWESGGAPAFFPWARAFEALGELLPDPSAATALDADAVRFQFFREAVERLRAASAGRPLLVILDDLHFADASSLRMLQFVARDLRALPVLILGTRRDVDPHMTAEAQQTLAQVAREGRTFPLRRLGRDDVVRILREPHVVPPDLEEGIWLATQGNPLFVEEVVRLIEADPEVAHRGAPFPVPFGVREVIRQRLAMLDPAARAVLDVAAAIGVEAEVSALAAASGKTAGEIAEALSSAGRAGILVLSGEGRVRFGHALTRDAVYRDLPQTRREELHGAIADALERTDVRGARLVEIAHHALEVGVAGPRLVERALRAAEALAQGRADEDAVALLERAVATTAQSPWSDAIAELWLALGRARLQSGDRRGGSEWCVRVADRARAEGNGVLVARAALVLGSELLLGETDPALRSLLEEGLRLLPPAHEPLRERLRARLAASLQPAPDPVAVGRMAISAADAARTLDDETRLYVLHFAASALVDAVDAAEKLPMLIEAVRLAARLGDRPKLLRAYQRLIFELVEVGDVATADAHIDAYEAEARATGQPRYMWPLPLLRAMRAMQEGRFDAADALSAEARELATQVADPMPLGTVTVFHPMQRFMFQDRGAELIALEPALVSVVARWNASEDYTELFRATIRAFSGDTGGAREHLARISLDSTPARVRISRGMLALTVLRAKDATRARELYESLLPSAGRWVVLGAAFAIPASFDRVLGGFATMLGRWQEAARHFEEAQRRAESIDARPELARVLAAHAEMLIARGAPDDQRAADDLLARARDLAEELGLVGFAASLPQGARMQAVARVASPPRRNGVLKLTREGDTWAVSLHGRGVRMKHALGVQYLARLVDQPGRDVHALDLTGVGGSVDGGDAGGALDSEARAAYKTRLAELDDDLHEAVAWNDGARATRARAEIEFLSAELSRAVGLGGRARRVGAAAERARVAVTRRLRDTIRRVTDLSPEMGEHLKRAVKTGTFCSYRPM